MGRIDGAKAVTFIVAAIVAAGCRRGEVKATLVFENVTLIDGTDRGAQPNMSVAIDGDKIAAVGPTARIKAPAAANRVDATGLYLIPGLWDNHVHSYAYGERSFALFLANGVTTIRDVGGDLNEVGWLRQESQYGRLLGPRMLIAGPVLDAPEIVRTFPRGRVAAPTPEAAVRVVDSLANLQVDVIKVHSMTPRAAYFAILARAKERGLRVVGHIPDSVSAAEAVDSGQRTIEHDFRLAAANSTRGEAISAWTRGEMKRYLDRVGKDFKIWEYFAIRVAGEDSAWMAYDSATASRFAARSAGKAVWFDPTLMVMQTQFRKNEPMVRNLTELRFAPKAAREFEDGIPAAAAPTPAMIEAGRRQYEYVKLAFRELVRARAKFLAGTDTPVMPLVPGFSLHRELELLVDLGLTPLEALQAASRNGAQAMGRDDLGTVEPGKSADLVLLVADPLENIANTKSIQTVLVRGRLLDRLTLDRMLRDAEAYAKQN